MSFTGMYVSRRKLKSELFTQINKLINWNEIEALIKQFYNKGFSVAGRPYPGPVRIPMKAADILIILMIFLLWSMKTSSLLIC